jgi:hypothetical protein
LHQQNPFQLTILHGLQQKEPMKKAKDKAAEGWRRTNQFAAEGQRLHGRVSEQDQSPRR